MKQKEHTTSAIDAATVDRIAELANLVPDEQEKVRLQHELGEIIGYFNRLEKLDTNEVLPLYHPHELENRLREDQVRPSEDREALLALAPRQKDGCILAPRTVE